MSIILLYLVVLNSAEFVVDLFGSLAAILSYMHDGAPMRGKWQKAGEGPRRQGEGAESRGRGPEGRGRGSEGSGWSSGGGTKLFLVLV